ncbi:MULTISPECIES: divergent PAP2 family protein [unclassified Treponema]|uniref:divergent PAP2 family protein n=1 Tax=unclassified Treponema TaxID=2638727 RepID=UPI001B192F18|nr:MULTISPECIES: divergent PAP2 family protein [unclassified Treponema]MBO6218907.1 divergent PAP2 family protein [Treponema sp.]MBQ8680542.1 divergent PAP2 family protein [Treponema sp.]
MLSNAGLHLQTLFSSPVFLACVFSWLCAQFIKAIIKLFSGNVHSLSELFELLFWRTGSMPSSHSSITACLCTTIGYRSGIDSDVFILACVFYLVTIRDAVGVRRANGMQARRLNEIGELLKEKGMLENYKKLKEVNGHSPMEAFVGSLLGFFIGIAFCVL